MITPAQRLGSLEAFAQNLPEEMRARFIENLRIEAGRLKPETLGNLRSHWTAWLGFACQPASPALPSKLDEVRERWDMATESYRSSSLKAMFWSIGKFYYFAESFDPIETPSGRQYRNGCLARASKAVVHKQPLTYDLLEPVLASSSDGRLVEIRDVALFRVMYEGMFDCEEAADLKAEAFAANPTGKATLRAQRRRRDGPFEDVVPLSEEACRDVLRWMAAGNVAGGALFRSIELPGVRDSVAITPRAIQKAVKNAFQRVGLAPDQVTASGLRIGALNDLLRYGAPTADIAKAAGFRSEARAFRHTTIKTSTYSAMQAMLDSFRESKSSGLHTADGRPLTLLPRLEMK